MTVVQHEHFVDDLDRLDAVFAIQQVDFRDHIFRFAHAVSVNAEGCVDAAKRAAIRAPKAGVNRRVGLPGVQRPETLPVMGAVAVHGQQMPDIAVQFLVEVAGQRGGWVVANVVAVAPYKPLDVGIIGGEIGFFGIVLQDVEQLPDRCRSFAVAGPVDALFGHCAFRQRRDMTADDDDLAVRLAIFDRGAGGARGHHLLGGGGRLVPEHDHADEPWVAAPHFLGDIFLVPVHGFGIDDFDGIAMI